MHTVISILLSYWMKGISIRSSLFWKHQFIQNEAVSKFNKVSIKIKYWTAWSQKCLNFSPSSLLKNRSSKNWHFHWVVCHLGNKIVKYINVTLLLIGHVQTSLLKLQKREGLLLAFHFIYSWWQCIYSVDRIFEIHRAELHFYIVKFE